MPAPPLTVRVGVGWNPLDRDGIGSTHFFETVELLEQLGYDSLWLSDTATSPGAAPLPVLAAVAARTERLKLGTSVLVAPPRQPVLLARELATVDRISNGRLLPALGLGIAEPGELAALGIDPRERVARLEEAVAVINALWSGRPASYRGRFTTFEDLTLSPQPVRERLEIWLSGSSPAALRRVGRLADGWLASMISPERFGDAVATIREAAADVGRAIDEDHYGTVLFAAPSDDQVGELRRMFARARLNVDLEDAAAVGADALRLLLERFRAAGATKFVVIPVGADTHGFLRRLKVEVIDPFEAAS